MIYKLGQNSRNNRNVVATGLIAEAESLPYPSSAQAQCQDIDFKGLD
jgi:hypothetical protein